MDLRAISCSLDPNDDSKLYRPKFDPLIPFSGPPTAFSMATPLKGEISDLKLGYSDTKSTPQYIKISPPEKPRPELQPEPRSMPTTNPKPENERNQAKFQENVAMDLETATKSTIQVEEDQDMMDLQSSDSSMKSLEQVLHHHAMNLWYKWQQTQKDIKKNQKLAKIRQSTERRSQEVDSITSSPPKTIYTISTNPDQSIKSIKSHDTTDISLRSQLFHNYQKFNSPFPL